MQKRRLPSLRRLAVGVTHISFPLCLPPAYGPVQSVISHTLANYDARAELNYVESEFSGHVHKLDQCMSNIPAKTV
jgi:hypothetical protein